MDEILDQPILTQPAIQEFEWWESKRFLYNFILGGYGIFCTYEYFNEMVLIDYLSILAFGLIANACFTLGWALSKVVNFRAKSYLTFYKYRKLLFLGGLAFSLYVISWIKAAYQVMYY